MSDSYLPFHRKYRPKTVKEYIGNERLKKSTLAALKEDKWPQVMLFTGGSGGGKTTFARLLAKDCYVSAHYSFVVESHCYYV